MLQQETDVPSKITDISMDKSFWEPLIYTISGMSILWEALKRGILAGLCLHQNSPKAFHTLKIIFQIFPRNSLALSTHHPREAYGRERTTQWGGPVGEEAEGGMLTLFLIHFSLHPGI